MRPPCTRSFRKQIAPLIVPWVEFLSELGSERILTQNPLKYYSFLCKNLKAGLSVSCTTDLTKLWLSPSAKILVLGSSCVLGFEGLLKSHNLLSVCQSGWKKIRNSPESGNSLSLLKAQNKDLNTALQTGVKFTSAVQARLSVSFQVAR